LDVSIEIRLYAIGRPSPWVGSRPFLGTSDAVGPSTPTASRKNDTSLEDGWLVSF
jgi:hypothetical protein